MRRYIVLLLITGILWAQTDFDTLILKSGTTYFGEYSKIEEEIVYFKPQNAFAFQPISIKQIQTLKLKDGHFIIGDGKNILTFSNINDEYQKEKIKDSKVIFYLFCSIAAVVFIVLIGGTGSWRCVDGCGGGGGYVPGDTVPIQ